MRAIVMAVLLGWAAPWFAAASLAAASTGAEPEPATTAVRTADHDTFGRVVFDLPPGTTFNVAIEGDRALVVFRGAGVIAQPAGLARNVVSVRTGPNTATLVLKPDTKVHAWRLDDRLLVDALDPPAKSSAPKPDAPMRSARASAAVSLTVPLSGPAEQLPTPKVSPKASGAASTRASTGSRTPAPGAASAQVPPVAPARPSVIQPAHTLPSVPPPPEARAEAGPAKGPDAAPVAPVLKESLGEGAAAPHDAEVKATPAMAVPLKVVAAPAAPPGGVVVADADVGAAAFRRGPVGVVVMDRRIPMEPPSWLPGAAVTLGAVSTVVQMPLGPDQVLVLSRAPSGWSVAVGSAVPEAALAPQPGPDGLVFEAPRAGRVVALLDPLTGGTLLVGTSLVAGPAAAVADQRRTPAYTVLPTWQGVAIEPLTERVDLRAATPGFVLTGVPVPPAASLAVRGRRFDVPDEPPVALMNRLRAQLASAASAAPRARTKDRMAAAQTMMALGMGIEAQSLMQLVATDDPQAAADARVQALAAIAAVMAGRPSEAQGLDDARLNEARPAGAHPDDASVKEAALAAPDEIVLWRGLRDRRLGLTTADTVRLPMQAGLAQAYPATLRRLVWPDVAEAAVESGVALPAEGLPPFAQALQLEKQGKIDEAKAAYATLVASPDRLDQVRAAARLVELRLASGDIRPAEAADAIERLSYAWRGDRREAGLRLRAAELRAAAGAWRPALDALRETETLFPDQKALVQTRKTAVFQAMLDSNGSGMTPLEVVLLAADYADCLPDGTAGASLSALLADKLLALDLPARAIPVLQGLVRGAPAGPARAGFGQRLAQLLLDGGDPGGALAALQASAAPAIPAALTEARALVAARATSAQGGLAGAVAILMETATPAADDLRATLQADAGDVQGSLDALADLAAKVVPADGPLPDAAQEVLMRQAAAAARAPDAALLRVLERQAGRMSGPRADLFRVLTAPPLAATADLPRAAKELVLARAIPQRLQALREK